MKPGQHVSGPYPRGRFCCRLFIFRKKMQRLCELSTKCGGRRLTEQGTVFNGKATELPKAVAHRDGRYGRCIGLRLAQRPPCEVHATQHQVALWPHTQMLMAAHLQCPGGNSDRLADFGDVERFLEILFDHPVKPAHDDRMLPLRETVFVSLAGGEAIDQDLDQRLFEASRCFSMGDNFRSSFCQQSSCRMELPQFFHRGWRRSDEQAIARWC